MVASRQTVLNTLRANAPLMRFLTFPMLAAASALAAPGPVFATQTLTGDWNGQRSALSARGLDLDALTGGTYQNIIAGGYRSEDGVLGASSLELRFDSARAGLWQGGQLRVRGEARYGDDVQSQFGGFLPLNVDSVMPHDPARVGRNTAALTEFMYTQTLMPSLQMFAGMLNSDEGDDNPLAGNLRRRDRFMHTALLSSPVRMLLSPQTALGFGFRMQPSTGITGDIRVYDSQEAVGQRLFERQDEISFATEWTYQYNCFGRPGRHLVGLRYGFDHDYSLAGSESLRLLSVLAPIVPGTVDHTWATYYNVSQSIADWGNGRGWGVFGRLGYGDNEANPIDWNAAFGAVATGPLATRPHDAAGWGYFHVYQVDGPLMQHFAYDDEQGWEAWYNAEVTPWLHITMNLQMIDSDIDRRHGGEATPTIMPGGLGASHEVPTDLIGRSASDISWVLGVRTAVRF